MSTEQEIIIKEFLIKLLNKSIEGLNETVNEVNRLQKKNAWYDFHFYQIHNMKTNIKYIKNQYDSNIRIISNEIKEQNESTKEILFNVVNQFESTAKREETRKYLNELINQINYLIDNTSHLFSLTSIFSALGLFSSIDSIISLFTGTGTGVLGIIPLQTVFVINNTASEIMFKDKLEELNKKLIFIIENIRIKKNQQLENLNLYFNNFRMKLTH